MSTWREIVYLILDEIKSTNGDSLITEEHVMYVANNYKNMLIKQQILAKGASSLSDSAYQTLCIDLEMADAIPLLGECGGLYLKSKQKIPNFMDESTATVYPWDYFNINIAIVSRDRFKFVGHNKYMSNIIYCTLGIDNYLYMKSLNPLYKYLKKAKVTGIFEDSVEAAELACDLNGKICDIMDLDFPLESDLIPTLVQAVVKELLSVEYRPADNQNDANDALASLAYFIAKNAKSSLAKQLDA